MPELAEMVTLDLAQKKMFVNGEEFPWFISEQGPTFAGLANPDEIRSVTLTFYAKDVEVIPEGPLTVEEARRRVERAHRDLTGAHEDVRRAAERATKAQEEFAAARDEAKRLAETSHDHG